MSENEKSDVRLEEAVKVFTTTKTEGWVILEAWINKRLEQYRNELEKLENEEYLERKYLVLIGEIRFIKSLRNKIKEYIQIYDSGGVK